MKTNQLDSSRETKESLKTKRQAAPSNKHGVSALTSKSSPGEVKRLALFTASGGELIAKSRVHVQENDNGREREVSYWKRSNERATASVHCLLTARCFVKRENSDEISA